MSIKVTVMSLDFESNQPPTTQVYEKDELVVGRSEGSDLVLSSPDISTDHAKISIRNDGGTPRIFVTDLGSSNGTLIESKPLSPNVAIPMATHERIVIGNYLIKPEITKDTPVKMKEANGHDKTDRPYKFEAKFSNDESSLKTPEPIEKVETVTTTELKKESLIEPVGLVTEEKEIENPFAPVASSAKTISMKVISGVLSEDQTSEITIEARELLTLSGKVTRKGQALVGVRIDAGSLGLHVTDTDGSFTFKDIPEDTSYRITASKDGYVFDEATIEGTVRSNERLTLEAKKLLMLKGKVIHKGVPLAGVTVDGGSLGTTITAADGSYSFRDVPEGTPYNLNIKKEGYTFN